MRADYADAVVNAVLILNQGLANFMVVGHVLGNPAVFGSNAARGVVFVDNHGALLAAAVGTLLLLGGGRCAVGAGFGFHAAGEGKAEGKEAEQYAITDAHRFSELWG